MKWKVESPYIAVYKLQVSSIFSIIEWITGIILLLGLFGVILLLKLQVILIGNYNMYVLYYYIFKNSIGSFSFLTLMIFMLLNLSYHIAFGFRYILWDMFGMWNIWLETLKVSAVNFVILMCIVFVMLLFFVFWI